MINTDHSLPMAMTIAEVSRRTGIGRTSIFEAIRYGRLRAIKAGSRTLVKAEDLAAFLDSLPAARTERLATLPIIRARPAFWWIPTVANYIQLLTRAVIWLVEMP